MIKSSYFLLKKKIKTFSKTKTSLLSPNNNANNRIELAGPNKGEPITLFKINRIFQKI